MPEAAAGQRSNLSLRLLTAAVWAPFLIYLLYRAPRWAFPIVAGIVCALGARELFVMLAPEHRVLQAWGIVASTALFSVIALDAVTVLPVTVVAITMLGMLVAIARPEPLAAGAVRMGWAVAGPLYIGGLFGTISALFRVPNGGSWVMLALLCGFLSDTGGYFAGRRFGRHPLAPQISPKKTIEGSIGGMAAGLISGLLAHLWFLPELALLPAIALSLFATAVGQAGDLCESLIKRSVGVKDSGSMLPGHGGILDRSDAMLFSAAAIWIYVAVFVLHPA